MQASAATLLLAGDVMTGRGIDQIMRHPSDPVLYERWIVDAREYVRLAERRNGPIPRGADDTWIWGEALELFTVDDTVRIINLETDVTDWPEPWPRKGINYRMHPRNIGCFTAAGIDCCVLANNHTLDWSTEGLLQTLDTLAEAGIRSVGAGKDLASAVRPVVLEAGEGRVLVFALGSPTSGIPHAWAARRRSPGVAYAGSLSEAAMISIAETIADHRRPGDVMVVSIHWGPNWGFGIDDAQRRFAQSLIDDAGVDVVHGHSSHHPIGIEVHRGRPIIYGCGDLINDYEGISGHDEYRPDLGVVYRLSLVESIDPIVGVAMIPFRRQRFRLEHATAEDRRWLASTLDRESRLLGTAVELDADGSLRLRW
jgi:poly-gamma-glutamate synthesis protein (capsule biosynthesis protein)